MTTNTSAPNTRRHDSNQHTQGLALCHRVTLDSVAHRWVPARTPTVLPEQGRPWVAHNRFHDTTTDKRQHDKDRSESTVFSATGAITHLESHMVPEPVRETGDLRRVVKLRERTRRIRVEVETLWIIKKIAQRNDTNHPGEDQPGDRVHHDSPESAH